MRSKQRVQSTPPGLESGDQLAMTPPEIDPQFLVAPEDLEGMVKGFKLTRRLMDAPALRALRKEDLFTKNVGNDDEIRSILRQKVDTCITQRAPVRWAQIDRWPSSTRGCAFTA
jgi:hypothetical protein